jgi:hypothetical protein
VNCERIPQLPAIHDQTLSTEIHDLRQPTWLAKTELDVAGRRALLN